MLVRPRIFLGLKRARPDKIDREGCKNKKGPEKEREKHAL